MDAFAGFIDSDTVTVAVWQQDEGFCVSIDQARHCSLGFTVGQAWGVFLYRSGWSEGVKNLLSVAWLTGLLIPIGYWAPRRWGSIVPCLAALSLITFAPSLIGTLATPVMQTAGAAFGILLGHLLPPMGV